MCTPLTKWFTCKKTQPGPSTSHASAKPAYHTPFTLRWLQRGFFISKKGMTMLVIKIALALVSKRQ